MSARLAIVIPSYNRIDRLRDGLASVTAHAPAGTDIVVVDDASTNSCVSRTVAEFPTVRCIRNPRRGGFCVAINRGIRATDAPIVETLNDDTRVCPGWADAALRLFDDPQVAAVAPLVLRPDGTIDSAGDGYDPGGFAAKRGHGQCEQHYAPGPVFGASGSSAFYRRAVLERVGLFPESFGAYFDDVDLAFRIQRAGGEVRFEPASRVIHECGASHGPADRRLIERQSCNEERVYWRNVPTSELLRTLPRHIAVLGGKALRRWREGRLIPWAVGRARAWSEVIECRRHERRLAALGPMKRLWEWGVVKI